MVTMFVVSIRARALDLSRMLGMLGLVVAFLALTAPLPATAQPAAKVHLVAFLGDKAADSNEILMSGNITGTAVLQTELGPKVLGSRRSCLERREPARQ